MWSVKDPADPLRAQLVRALDWDEAHVGFDAAIDDIPVDRRGSLAPAFEHSIWQLLEHMRLAQKDILDFCLNPRYTHTLKWPDDYWPRDPAPPDAASWNASVAGFKADREALTRLAQDTGVDLFALVPTGKGHQTYLRALLLVVDHNAYHLGQLVAVRRALSIWR
jgi:uncharacterized damage-inducible protein DinB